MGRQRIRSEIITFQLNKTKGEREMAEKRENPTLYFLKLQDDFFKSSDMKRLRKVAGGATYTVIYLKMLVESLPYGGKLYFEGLDPTFEEQISLMIDENVDDIRMTMGYLERIGAVQYGNSNTVLTFVNIPEMTYQITESSLRSRKSRAKKRAEALEASKQERLEEKSTIDLCCNATQVQHNSNDNVLQCNTDATEMQSDCSIDNKIYRYSDNKDKDIKSDEPTSSIQKRKRTPFIKPTLEELQEYIESNNYSFVDAIAFMNYYDDHDWMCNKAPMRNWKNAVYAWNKNQKCWREEKAAPKNDKNSFMQNSYDFDQLEKDLVRN